MRLWLDGFARVAALTATMTGCGAGSPASSRRDGGDGGLIEASVETGDVPRAALTGIHSFDVVASVRPDPAKGPTQSKATLPSSDSFTLTLDADVPRFIVGGGGSSQVVPATTIDGVTFRSAMPVVILRPGSNCSQGTTSLSYESLEATVSGTTLRGTGAGSATFVSGDVGSVLPFLADLTGGPDATPPFLVTVTGIATSPFDDIEVAPSEPLPATATARLVSSDGSYVDLVPFLTKGDLQVIGNFAKPDVVLHPGAGYAVSVDGLVDFAGNSGAHGAPLRVGSFPAAPLIPQDGFESATGPGVGGALLIRDGSSLAPITGATSAYIGAMGAPVPPGTSLGARLLVRMSRQPGNTKLLFSYREVGSIVPLAFNGSVEVGAVDGPVARTRIFAQSMTVTQVMVVPGTLVSLSDLKVMELALPASATSEVVVSIDALAITCGLSAPGVGLLFDDLRLE